MTDAPTIPKSTQKGPCAVAGCEKSAVTRGWCRTHYRGWLVHGDPSAVVDQRSGLKELRRLLEIAKDTNDCVPWTRNISKVGYGIVRHGKYEGAHRLACFLAHGHPPKEKMEAAHTCRNRACVNPKHIRWATQQQNIRDKFEHGLLRLSEEDFRTIRRLGKTMGINAIARATGFSNGSVEKALKGITGKWVQYD